MRKRSPPPFDESEAWGRQHLPLKIVAAAQRFLEIINERLIKRRGDDTLTISHAIYPALLSDRDWTPGDLAARLEISKQACSRIMQSFHSRGFIKGHIDTEDGRSSIYCLSRTGRALLSDVAEIASELHHEAASLIGARRTKKLLAVVERLCKALAVAGARNNSAVKSRSPSGDMSARIVKLLPALNVLLHRRLLSPDGSQCLGHMPSGTGRILYLVSNERLRLIELANLIGVSKQSVSARAAKLEELGYAIRLIDPTDRRHLLLEATATGRAALSKIHEHSIAVNQKILDAVGTTDYCFLDEVISVSVEIMRSE